MSEKTQETKEKEKQQEAEKNGKKAASAPVTEFKFGGKPTAKKGLDGFLEFIWNSEKGEFLGRTGTSWLKIGIFYLVYYSCLAAFFMIMLLIFFTSLWDHRPTYLQEESLIGVNPGVGYRPMPPDKDIESTLIWFRHGEANGNYEPWIERLEDHLKDYKDENFQSSPAGTENGPVECPEGTKTSSGFCKVNTEDIFQDRCTFNSSYGFREGKPCILIKLNKIYGWEPPVFEIEEDLPENIPPQIKDDFLKNIEDNNAALNDKVWLHCDGENPADRENLGHITYFPDRGFGAQYFPFMNQKQYLAPIVFAALDNPKKGVMIAVECKAWVMGIRHDSMDRIGLVHFELMID